MTTENIYIPTDIEIAILGQLITDKCVAFALGLDVIGLAEALEKSQSTIRRGLKKLTELNYVAKGKRIVRCETFFITPEGMEYYTSAFMPNVENEDLIVKAIICRDRVVVNNEPAIEDIVSKENQQLIKQAKTELIERLSIRK